MRDAFLEELLVLGFEDWVEVLWAEKPVDKVLDNLGRTRLGLDSDFSIPLVPQSITKKRTPPLLLEFRTQRLLNVVLYMLFLHLPLFTACSSHHPTGGEWGTFFPCQLCCHSHYPSLSTVFPACLPWYSSHNFKKASICSLSPIFLDLNALFSWLYLPETYLLCCF